MIILSGLAPKPYSITPAGVEELRTQLRDLKRRRMELAQEMREITSQSTDMGALEDSVLTVHQNRATELDGQIVLLERIIGMADIIKPPATCDCVEVGSRVALNVAGKEQTYTVVGVLEADPLEGKISNESPLGRSLLGRRAQESFEIVTPARRTAATVMWIG
jgi:transcription elongation factor GreA